MSRAVCAKGKAFFEILRSSLVVASCGLLAAGCSGSQSALHPAGREADQINTLFWWMAVGATIVWLGVVILTLWAVRRGSQNPANSRVGSFLIIGGGAIFPTVVLTVLLAYGLSILPGLVAPAPEGSLRIAVDGEQWWWRVRYIRPDGHEVHLANEIRLPVGEPVQFQLTSSNVIHAFWIPSIGGKRDMIPGRITYLALTPTRTGIFRGACAEYCGTSHALMSFYVEVMEKQDFLDWLEAQSAPAQEPQTQLAQRGSLVFQANGCGACHAVRGTYAEGLIAPDLTHVGSRFSLAAGILTNHPPALANWIAHPEKLKPGVLMPGFAMLPREDREALVEYLVNLK